MLCHSYALLLMRLLFSVAAKPPAPGLVLMRVGHFGLLWAVHKLQHSGWAVPVVFAFTGVLAAHWTRH